MGRTATHLPTAGRSANDDLEDYGDRHIFKDETLSGRLRLDDSSFDGCQFQSAVLVYAGGDPPRIRNCAFHEVSFEFVGAAGRTLAFLKAMSTPASGLRDVFKAAFPSLSAH